MYPKLNPKDPAILSKIAQLIKEGADPSEFDEIIDQALGTGIPEKDLEKDQLWQDENGAKVGRKKA